MHDISVEHIKHFRENTAECLTKFLNECLILDQIPNICRIVNVAATLKPIKQPSNPKSFRPISVFCNILIAFEKGVHYHLDFQTSLVLEQVGPRTAAKAVLNL